MRHILKKSHIFGVILLISSLISGCLEQDPLTGRSHLNLVSASSLNQMSFKQYDEIIQKHGLSTDPVKTAMVKQVGFDIKNAVEEYCSEIGIEERLKNFDWEFKLIECKEENAFCMPGGKVGIYTGILKITEDEDGLAVVMAHEIAHAIAEHSRERMSQAMLINMGGLALGQAMQRRDNKAATLFMGLYGIGANVGFVLPHSRTQEYEADKLGLRFMAMAGYDPRAAVSLWERMSQKSSNKPPEFLSTHPTDENRINQIKKLLPEAIDVYNKSKSGRSGSYNKNNSISKKIVLPEKPEMSKNIPGDLEKARLENEKLKKQLGLKK